MIPKIVDQIGMAVLLGLLGVCAWLTFAAAPSGTSARSDRRAPVGSRTAAPRAMAMRFSPLRETAYLVGTEDEAAVLRDAPHFSSGPGAKPPAIIVVPPGGDLVAWEIFRCTSGDLCSVAEVEIVDLRRL